MAEVDATDTKVQPFVLLAKGTRGRALADLITRATAEPGLFGFGELLAVPSVSEVSVWLGRRVRGSLHMGVVSNWGLLDPGACCMWLHPAERALVVAPQCTT
jgi:hypothetical protein